MHVFFVFCSGPFCERCTSGERRATDQCSSLGISQSPKAATHISHAPDIYVRSGSLLEWLPLAGRHPGSAASIWASYICCRHTCLRLWMAAPMAFLIVRGCLCQALSLLICSCPTKFIAGGPAFHFEAGRTNMRARSQQIRKLIYRTQ
jgi:hypothetical protein